jgi:exoribonuclease-2
VLERSGSPTPKLGVVQVCQGSKVHLAIGQAGKSQVVPQRDVQLICPLPPGAPAPPRLGVLPWQFGDTELGAAVPRRRDLAAAWLLLEENGGDLLELADWCELVSGTSDPVHRAAGWLWLHGPQLWFRLRQQLITARPRDDLRRLRREHWRRQLRENRLLTWHGALKARQPLDPASLSEDHRQELALLHDWAGEQTELPLPAELTRGLQAAHCPVEPGAIRHLLVDLGQWHPHHLPSLSRSCWDLGFTAELEAEARRLAEAETEEHPGDRQRLDLCAQRCVTIDDDDTLDVDDGLALERDGRGQERLWIHVADPGRLVAPGSPLDLEAQRRATSLYLARGSLPMFPPELSHGAFSLRANRRCPAWSVWVELDDDGAITASGVERSWVRPVYRLSYADADDLIELAPPQEEDLGAMHELLLRRRQWRVGCGALLLDQPEGRIRDAAGNPQLEVTEPGPSRLMVAEAMILAGSVVAEMGRQHGLPLPYRSQPAAVLPSPEELAALPAGPVRHAAIKRCLSRGHTGTQPSPHFSLGLPAYVQATSPIRRYADLVVQRQLQALKFEEQPLDDEQLQTLLAELEGPLRQAMQISREDQRHWQQVWFAAHRGQAWRGLFLRWLRPQDGLGLVHVEDLAMDLAAECPRACEPGLPVMLRVQQVDPLRDLLRLIASP